MLYRELGATAEQVSILGFGCMRLPVVGGRRECIDVPLATKMLHHAVDHGVNYVDTAFPYHGGFFDETPGTSEAFVGEALAGGYRDKVLLATKLPGWLVKSRADMDRILAGQLERLRSDHIDCYLLHAMGAAGWAKLADLGVRDFLDAARADGRIRYAGFSYHDDSSAFAPIVDAYDWDFCQIQYNFMDVEFQAGAAGVKYAADHGLGVIVMEPLKGGRLAGRVPAAVQDLWDTSLVKRTPVEWALRFVWDEHRVNLLLSGMSTLDQVVTNVALADKGNAGALSRSDLELIEQVREAYRARIAVDCTACLYCMPCPSGINIPLVLSLLNNASLFDDPAREPGGYKIVVAMGQTARASDCTECGQCEEACPQQIKVTEELAKAVRMFES